MPRHVKAGMKLRSAVCDTQIMTLKAPAREIDIRIGGAPALLPDEEGESTGLDPQFSEGTLAGKRYVDADETMEFLCTKAGQGTVSVDGVALAVKLPKALPSSD